MKVRLTSYDENWARMYEEEAQVLRGIFGDEIRALEHFGSTAVPGMKAKPVVDMMCLVKDIQVIDGYNDRMHALGYDVAGEWGIAGRRLFRKGGEQRTHHIHFYPYEHPQILRHLVFRDYLRAHPEEVERYTAMKEELAQRYEDTSDYSKGKKPFVQEMEQRALQWHSEKTKYGTQ